MNNLKVLDCTLRDGGYCNQWMFGYENTKKIVSGLVDAGIDIIECGFLSNIEKYNKDITKYNLIEQVRSIIPLNRNDKNFVCMINYGEYKEENIPEFDGSSIDGIRIAFHKKDMREALSFCKKVQKKGYKVFVQPMVSLSYTDEEFLDLIHKVNEFSPYAFYIVDSFGVMKRKDLIRLFYMVENNLLDGIIIGYHSHNNMQLAYSNAQTLVDIRTKRDLIIDTSVFGMGRGAGNLNTELFVDYLNENVGTAYQLKPLLCLIDEILNAIYQKNYWGYSLPNYLSASYNTHPNYAQFLADKSTLTLEAMDDILAQMEDDKRNHYDKQYIHELYMSYLTKNELELKNLNEFLANIDGKKVLLIAPGKSVINENEKIQEFITNNNVIVVGINFECEYFHTDYIFISNLRRFKELAAAKKQKCIVTSNIQNDQVYMKVNIKELLNNEDVIYDNAGLMSIKFFINLGIREIYLAGFDGYTVDCKNNYIDEKMSMNHGIAVIESMNIGIKKVLKEYGDCIDIKFLTKSKNYSNN